MTAITSGAVEQASLAQPSLRIQALRGSAWTMGGYVAGMAMRLGGNIIVARLLFPEAFGVMGVVFAVMTGLTMFSDIGLGPGIIQHRRGNDPVFLRTAWTIQILRGFLIWLLAIPLAWPLYRVNHEPVFLWLMPVAGLTMVLSGLQSVSLFTCKRRLDYARATILHVAAQFAGTVAMIAAVWAWPSVWALLAHGFVSLIVLLAGSHYYVPEVPMGLQWEPEAVGELIRFGRWIFLSTALTFLVSRLDVLILGGLVGMATLGLYNVAKNYSRVVVDALMTLSSAVLFPVYARMSAHDPERRRAQTFRLRAVILGVFLPPLCVLAVGGHLLVDFLYDARYAEAGWILELLAAGSVAAAITTTIEPVLLSHGDSFGYMVQMGTRLGFQITGMLIGARYGGTAGFIAGLVAADIINYPVLALLVRKYGVWMPGLDVTAFAVSCAAIGAGWWLM